MSQEHRQIADRILHGLDLSLLTVDQKIAVAHAHATIALADEQHTADLLKLLAFVSELPPIAKVILLAEARRRLGILPPAPDEDSDHENGGV